MPDLLLEVLSEEIPARMQRVGTQELPHHVTRQLHAAGFSDGHSERFTWKTFATPRRIAILVRDLPEVQPDITMVRKGPRIDAPQKAIQGFLKSNGLTLEDCEQRETPKGFVWFAITQEKGRPTGDLLAELLPEALAAVPWPKSMRWEESGARWVRPIRSILCLLDDQVVPFRFAAVESGRTTLGHRFLSAGPLTIGNADRYEATLRASKVMLSFEERAESIKDCADSLPGHDGLTLRHDEWLAIENAGLVEWPSVLMGSIEEEFMSLPAEVLRSAMATHQRYFMVLDEASRPAPKFVMVANTETADGGGNVIAGNERVLRARLADARFFWDQDRRRKLEDYLPQLVGVVFHARLGSMADKARRIERLARLLCSRVPGADPNQATRAGILCKADLVTEMVGEFPDLQGVMGRYYANASGEQSEVCEAIAEHYAPRGPGEPCPTAPLSVAVALADKLDTLAGFFAIDERPTSSKDPFALRRASLGVIRLIVDNRLRLPLKQALNDALSGYSVLLPESPSVEGKWPELLAFIVDRLKVHLRDQGKRHDLVSAVFGVGDEDDLMRLLERVQALDHFLDGEDGANLLIAYRRAANILRIEEKRDGERYDGAENRSQFTQDEEHNLYNRLNKTIYPAHDALMQGDFEKSMALMATLRAPVDAFFDNVTVNCEDPALRRNRLLMLSRIRVTLDMVADFSKIEG